MLVINLYHALKNYFVRCFFKGRVSAETKVNVLADAIDPLDIGHSSYTIFLTHRKFNKFSLVSEISDKSSDKFRNKT